VANAAAVQCLMAPAAVAQDVPYRVLTLTAVQTAEDIARIVRQAQHPPAGPAGWDQDECVVACYDLSAVEQPQHAKELVWCKCH
jgi:2-keto-3-deoxy-L-rhamnonate aldolase RhmA